ncbi:MAG TPA: response regulator [Deltaproteobacteria bacterium]|nr:response regulator [Deltaproteobacteria bacterium]
MLTKLAAILRGGVARKIVFLLFAFGIVPLGILAFVFFSFYYEGQKQNIIDVQKEIGERVSTNISAYLDKTSGQIQLFAGTITLHSHSKEELQTLSSALLDRAIEFDEITIADLEGNEVNKVSRYYTFRPFELGKLVSTKSFRHAMEGKIHVSQVEISEFSKFPLVRITAPIIDRRYQITGALVVGVNIVKMWDFISKYSIGENRYAYIVDPKGFLIAYKDLSSVLEKRDLKSIQGVSNLLNGKIGVFEYTGLIGERVIGTNALIPLTQWGVIVEEPVKVAYKNLYLLSAVFLTIFIITVLLALFLGFRFSYKQIIRPINLFQKEAEAIAKGEFDHKIDLKSTDEIGQLAVSFNRMADDLNHTTVSRDLLVQEISERKKTEDALKKSEATLKSIFLASPIAIGLVSNRVLEWVNDRMFNMLGYSKDELIGQSARILYPTQEEFEWVGTEEYSQISERGMGTVETRWLRKDGSPVDILLSSSPIDDSDWSSGVIFTALDIKERKIAEEVIRTSTEIVRTIPSGLFIYQYEPEDRLILLDGNPAAERLTGIKIDAWRGKEFNEIWPEARERDISAAFLNVMKTGKIYETEDLYYKDDRLEGAFSVRVFSMPGDRLGVAFENITERKRAEEEREKLEAQLRQAHKMESVGTLAGGIAHDFNNILGIILGNSELAMDDVPEWNPARQNLREIRTACLRAKELTKQILAFSRKSGEELKPVKIGTIAKEALALLRSSIPTTIAIHQDISSESDIVRADPTQINQVLINLCTNAAHAMREKGGVFEVTLENINITKNTAVNYHNLTAGEYVQLTVTDTGHGIDPDVLERIFDPYFTTKNVGDGSGMGLAVVHGIVKSHGGDILVRSKPGKGTTFHVLFPCIREAPEPKIEVAAEIPRGSENILIVDDEKAVADVTRSMIERLGYQVAARTSSIEALEAFRSNPDRYDLVITDYTMPNMTGVELAEKLLALRTDIPIVLCTGYSEQINETKAKSKGIRAFIMKPIALSELAKTIRNTLDQS